MCAATLRRMLVSWSLQRVASREQSAMDLSQSPCARSGGYLVMTWHHRAVVGAARPSRALALSLMGTLLALSGLILLVGGVMEGNSSPTASHRGGTRIWSDASAGGPNARSLLSAAGQTQKTERAVRNLPASPLLAVLEPRLLRTTREDWMANARFASAPSVSGQSFTEDERLSVSAVLVEEQDPRRALLFMAAVQQTGHWITACPCSARQTASLVEPYDAPTSGPR
jgi:hypothetical protein